ncbi:MAG: hypothetical protein HKM29_00090, partial [Deltaproteobacteria bacterium]|nr:hypothetical protein [Deltaproteobacteria bacterium]
MRRWGIVFMVILLTALLVCAERGEAGRRFIRIDTETDADGGGENVDLVVREVRVSPIVAHVGDTILFEMILEDYGDPPNMTITIEILANGKEVAGRLFTFGFDVEPGKIYRETFQWNTKGMPPGEYRIRGEAYVWGDNHEFDNFLDVKEPLVLLPVGAALPAGKEDGGTAVR